ncbi:8-oxoguanine glycosylase ogg1 [Hypocenomyce scalaris]|nr:8-oxoguanine glycosylase ogg1 [Hypocenomyce scalaris]
MAAGRAMNWRKLPVSLSELCIDTTLRCGQSFRWRKSGNDEWACALHGRILSLRQDQSHLHYRAIFPGGTEAPPTPPASAPSSTADSTPDDDDTEAFLQHYLNLGPNLKELYGQWSTADLNFKKKAPKFTGVRILKQDAWEALVGFICSSNNNIARISQMMENLCVHYGPLIGHIDSRPYYDMPSPSSLTHPKVEAHLRQLGFGYRAKYLHQTAVMLTQERDHGWLDDLRNPESPVLGCKIASAGEMLPGGREGYRNAHEKLLELLGVGPKVADCVCLMGLGWGEAVPVDTHVWQIAQRDYKFGKGKHRSLTKATYDAIGDHFRSLWGKEAGWAHSVLFTADLRAFSERLSTKVEVKQELVKKEEDADSTLEMTSAVTLVAKERIKREFEEDEKTVINIAGTRKVKRRRRV